MPRYIHDCDQCRFVASVGKYDIYTCVDSLGTTYIARRGNEVSNYSSMCDFGNKTRGQVKSETGGLSDNQLAVLVTFRLMPSLILNMVVEG